ncbi:hypothetical protein ACOMHN_065864 [Nucella lapillus]
MPGQRGILGLKKDPKNQVLFMYDGEEWPSSDSDDTDYEPGQKRPRGDGDLDMRGSDSDSEDSLCHDVSSPPKKKSRSSQRNASKKQPAQKSRSKKKPTDASLSSTGSSRPVRSMTKGKNVGDSSAINNVSSLASHTPVARLPVELWLKIFEFAVQSEGALPFLVRATRVCREWWHMAKLPSLWRKVDLTYGWIKSTDTTLKWLANHRLSECREINVSGWKNLTINAIKEVAQKCPDLEVVNLSRCSKLSADTARVLADGCPKIHHLDLSYSSPIATSAGSMKYFVSQAGSRLKDLNLAGNVQSGFTVILKALRVNCRNLESLDLSNTWVDLTMNVEELQETLPHLRILGLGNCYVRSSKDNLRCQGAGFAKLEELSCAFSPEKHQCGMKGVADSLLIRLLHKAEKLRLLDLRGCAEFNPWKSIFSNGTTSPVTDLEELHLGHSSITRYSDCLTPALEQWGHSLRVLDLSWVTPRVESLEEAFRSLSHLPSSCPLTQLNLAGSSVSTGCVLMALDKFRDLKSVDLTSCRAVPRGLKCRHAGPKALKKLRSSLTGHATGSDTDSY